jgi:hypothetical protein
MFQLAAIGGFVSPLALKRFFSQGATGYQINFASIAAQNNTAQLRGPTIELYFSVASRFDLAPLSGRVAWCSVPRVETLG